MKLYIQIDRTSSIAKLRKAANKLAILDQTEDLWRQALKIPKGEEPVALILEGTWWRETATAKRLSYLSGVKELPFPEMYLGSWNGNRVAYCCAYGAPRAVEPAHIFAQLGTPLLIQIGTCGTLDAEASTGKVILPETCAARDGISQCYGVTDTIDTDQNWLERSEALLAAEQVQTQRAFHLTWPSLFAQSDEMCDQWTAEGLLSIDMETSIVAAVANYFGVSAIAMLSVWDALPHGRTFLDPLEEEDSRRLNRSNEKVFEVALTLAEEASDVGTKGKKRLAH